MRRWSRTLLATGLLPLALGPARAAVPHCPAPASVEVFVDDPNGGAPDVVLAGTLADPAATCDGSGATSYATTLHCTGAQPCGRLTGLRPGAWINRLRVQVPSSDVQVQAARAVFLAAGSGVANTLRWTVYPRTVTVAGATEEDLRARLADAATGPGPALVTFAPEAFPAGQGDAHPIVLTSGHCTPQDVAGLCLTASHVVVDALDTDGAPGAVTLTTNDRARLVRVYGSDDVLRGLVLRGSRAAPATRQADTLVVAPGAHAVRIERCVIHGPSLGDGVAVGGEVGEAPADATVVGTEISDAEDKGMKVTAGSHATVQQSCVHDNDNGGIQATLGGHVVTRENLVQHNVPPGADNGLVVIGDNRERTTLDSRGDVVRFSGGRGVSVTDSATATFVDDYVADNAVAGAKVETTVARVVPTVTFRGTALVCNKVKGVAGVCPTDAREPCVTDADCCHGDPLCTQRCGFRTPEGFGLALAACTDPGCLPPAVDFGTARAPGANALTQNRNTTDGINLNQRLAGQSLPAIGNQWEHCGTAPGCDRSAIDAFDVKLAPGALAEVSPGDVARAGVPVPLRVSPGRPRKGELVRVYGQHFNAIAGAACTSATAPLAPCSADDPAVAQQNRLDPDGNMVSLAFPGAAPLAVDVVAVTPTMLAFTMPVDCYAAGTLHVAKRTLAGTREGRDVALCDARGCQGQPDGAPCDDGDACTIGDACEADECRGGPPLACGGACLGCDPALGCVPLAANAPCDDGNACTIGDHCRGDADVCLAGPDGGCNGQCLTGACGPGGTCVVSAAGAPCSDGNACTDDACDAAGTCVAQPASGFPSVTCVFEGAGLRAPTCDHDRVPRSVSRRYARAQRLAGRAAAARTPAGAKRRLLRTAATLDAATHLTTVATQHGRLSTPCAASLVVLFDDARTRALALAATL